VFSLSKRFLRGLCALCGFFCFVIAVAALTPDVLRSSGAVPAYVAGQFREPAGFQQSASGQYFVFDRRGHTVYGLDNQQSSAWPIVTIGGESGKIIDPTAFAVEPNGTFVVADAPNNRERIQIFTPAGFRIGGFLLPGRMRPRVTFESFVLNGYACASVILDAIGRVDPSMQTTPADWREAIRAEVTAPGRVYQTPVGTIGFDANGDAVPQRVSIYRADATAGDWIFWELLELPPGT